jgi:Family of unknown function (DUF6282)
MLYRRRSPGVGIQRGKEMKTWLVGLGSAVLVSLLPLVAARAQAVPDPILAGTIDMHIHTEADMMAFGGSSLDDYELAKKARDAGMRAIVIKPIYFESASRAYLVRKLLPGFEVFGGVILNHNVGGMNPAAVEGFARLAGGTKKVVWMPNIDSQRQIEFYKLNRPGVRISNGTQLLPETLSVLDAIARHKLILATSHASAEEALLLIREGRARGIENIVVTHAIQDPINMTVEQMKEAAGLAPTSSIPWSGCSRASSRTSVRSSSASGASPSRITPRRSRRWARSSAFSPPISVNTSTRRRRTVTRPSWSA